MEILITVVIFFILSRIGKQNRLLQGQTVKPNQPRSKERKMERQMERQAKRDNCYYEAAYSKGKPDRIGRRGDYEPGIPSGMERIKCAYCGAENFVPTGSRQHYHCYFCWEKL